MYLEATENKVVVTRKINDTLLKIKNRDFNLNETSFKKFLRWDSRLIYLTQRFRMFLREQDMVRLTEHDMSSQTFLDLQKRIYGNEF